VHIYNIWLSIAHWIFQFQIQSLYTVQDTFICCIRICHMCFSKNLFKKLLQLESWNYEYTDILIWMTSKNPCRPCANWLIKKFVILEHLELDVVYVLWRQEGFVLVFVINERWEICSETQNIRECIVVYFIFLLYM
jgi:hypothetical protein